jgi:hypothetical protein
MQLRSPAAAKFIALLLLHDWLVRLARKIGLVKQATHGRNMHVLLLAGQCDPSGTTLQLCPDHQELLLQVLVVCEVQVHQYKTMSSTGAQ